MMWTLLCVIVLYIVFLWNKLLGIRIDVVTNLRVVNVVVRSSGLLSNLFSNKSLKTNVTLTADSIEKSFLPLTSIDTIYAGYNQVTFNSKRPAFTVPHYEEEGLLITNENLLIYYIFI